MALPKGAQTANTMPRVKAAVYTAGFIAVGIVGVWVGMGLKDDHSQRSAQKKLFQDKGIEDDVEKRIALLEQRKARLGIIKAEIEKKAARVQDRIDGKEERQPQALASRQSVWKDN
ncbi:hypothetical protein GQ53DRAFT_834611 [Thozetella sp. PMI_491]|nr:hypothetical protein GQ53DRAFT_834611 [Thozetella sp. PMI_491]